jgi:hypothetical protein
MSSAATGSTSELRVWVQLIRDALGSCPRLRFHKPSDTQLQVRQSRWLSHGARLETRSPEITHHQALSCVRYATSGAGGIASLAVRQHEASGPTWPWHTLEMMLLYCYATQHWDESTQAQLQRGRRRPATVNHSMCRAAAHTTVFGQFQCYQELR